MMQQNNSVKQYYNSKGYSVINECNTDDVFESIYTTIVFNKQRYLGVCLGQIIDSVVSHLYNISKYNPLAGSSYIRLQLRIQLSDQELYCLNKGLTNIQNINDNEFLKKFYEWYKISSESQKYSQNCFWL